MHAVVMKRRNFVRSLVIAPVAPSIFAGEQVATNDKPVTTTPAQQPHPQANTPARQVPQQPSEVPQLEVTAIDLTGDATRRYFTETQFSTLRKLGAILLPPLKNNPGAIESQAPEFLDFLISVSPEDRQKLYLMGLDSLQAQAKDKFQKSFCDLDMEQADTILKPLIAVRPWPQDFPSDPLENFIAQVHEDFRTATMNSREWAAAAEKSGHHFTRGFHASGYYWAPIDPICEG